MKTPNPLEVTIPFGRKVDVEVRGHVIRTDQPLDNWGADSAPTPFELFLASIGACAGIFVQGFCAARSLPTDGIRIVETPQYDEQGVLRDVALDLQLPADFPERYKEAVVRAIDGCSVKKAIAAQPRISVSLSSGAMHDDAGAITLGG